MAAALLPGRSPRNGRRGHRHQRQDLGRRLHPADLDTAWAMQRRQPGHSRACRSRRGPAGTPTPPAALTTPIRWNLHRCLACLKRRRRHEHLAIEASSHGLDQYRLDGAQGDGCRLHQPVARPPGLPRRSMSGLPRRQAALFLRAAGRRRTAPRCSTPTSPEADGSSPAVRRGPSLAIRADLRPPGQATSSCCRPAPHWRPAKCGSRLLVFGKAASTTSCRWPAAFRRH